MLKFFLFALLLGLTPCSQKDKAKRIHKDLPVVDGHNDLPWAIRQSGLALKDIDLTKYQKKFHTDLRRLREGGVGLQLWSAYVPASTAEDNTALKTTLEQIELIHSMHKAYPKHLKLVANAAEAQQAIQANVIAGMIGVEGGYSIENSLSNLKLLFDKGVRYMTLTHSKNISWADSATDTPQHHGLTKFGEDVIREMNRLGIIVDISHVSFATMKRAMQVSQSPVIASHSSAYALARHPRNVHDDILKLMRTKGGVIMVNFYSGYIRNDASKVLTEFQQTKDLLKQKYPKQEDYRKAVEEFFKEHPLPKGSVDDVVDHIDHIARIAGIDHVGLGSDFDGVGTLPEGLENVSQFPNITAEMLSRGYSETDIRKVLGGNFFRVLKANEAYAKGQQSHHKSH